MRSQDKTAYLFASPPTHHNIVEEVDVLQPIQERRAFGRNVLLAFGWAEKDMHQYSLATTGINSPVKSIYSSQDVHKQGKDARWSRGKYLFARTFQRSWMLSIACRPSSRGWAYMVPMQEGVQRWCQNVLGTISVMPSVAVRPMKIIG